MTKRREVSKSKDNLSDEVREFIEEHEGGLQIDEHALDDAWRNHVTSFYEVSKRLSFEGSRRDAAKQNLKLVESRVDLAIRRTFKEENVKFVERDVESRKAEDESVREAQAITLELDHNVSALAALKEAYVQRSYALKELVNLWIASYYGETNSETTERIDAESRARNTKDRIKKRMTRNT